LELWKRKSAALIDPFDSGVESIIPIQQNGIMR
jgi:hypothetical protein